MDGMDAITGNKLQTGEVKTRATKGLLSLIQAYLAPLLFNQLNNDSQDGLIDNYSVQSF